MSFTPIWWDGFEDGTVRRWDTMSGGSVYSTFRKYGEYCAELSGNADYCIKQFTTQTEVYGSLWWRSWANPLNTFGHNVVSLYDGTTKVAHFKVLNTAVLTHKTSLSATWYSSAYTAPIAEWIHFQFYLKIGSSGVLQAKVNNVTVINETYDLSAHSGIDKIQIGQIDASVTWGYGACAIDNVIIGTGGWPGDLQIGRLPVDGDGTTSQWTPSTGSDHYALLDETPVSSDDFVSTNTVDQVDQWTVPDMGFGVNNIYGIAVVTNNQVEGSPTPQHMSHVVRTGGTDYIGTSIEVPSDGAVMTVWATNPNTAAAWTQSEVQGSEIGVKSLT